MGWDDDMLIESEKVAGTCVLVISGELKLQSGDVLIKGPWDHMANALNVNYLSITTIWFHDFFLDQGVLYTPITLHGSNKQKQRLDVVLLTPPKEVYTMLYNSMYTAKNEHAWTKIRDVMKKMGIWNNSSSTPVLDKVPDRLIIRNF